MNSPEFRLSVTSMLYSGLIFLAVLNPPLFFGIPNADLFALRILQNKHFYTPLDEPAVPLVALIVLLLGILSWRRLFLRFIALEPESIAPILLSLFFVSIGTVAFFSSGEIYAFLGAIQYSAIPLSYIAGRAICRDVNLFAYVITSFLLYFLLILAAFVYVDSQYGLSWYESWHRVRMATPGLFVYIPAYFICLAYLSIGLAKSTRDFVLAFVCILLLTVVMFFNWSRASVVIGVTTPALAIASIGFLRRNASNTSKNKIIPRSTSFLLALSCAIVLIAPHFGLLAKRGEYASIGADEATVEFFTNMERSNMARTDFLLKGIRIWLEQPILGMMFKPQESNFSEGRLIPRKRVFQSHNQYLDILVKSGLVGFLIFAWFIIVCVFLPLKRILKKKTLRSDARYDVLVFASLLFAIAVAANFQLYVTVWTTGIPITFLTGYLISTWEKEDAVRPYQSAANQPSNLHGQSILM